MRVLICGSRTWDDRTVMYRIMKDMTKQYGRENLTLIQGEAKGADLMAKAIAKSLGWNEVLEYPADWDKYGRRAGFVRNSQMLTANPDLVIAFRMPAVTRSIGTDMMLRLATDAGVDTETYYPEP